MFPEIIVVVGDKNNDKTTIIQNMILDQRREIEEEGVVIHVLSPHYFKWKREFMLKDKVIMNPGLLFEEKLKRFINRSNDRPIAAKHIFIVIDGLDLSPDFFKSKTVNYLFRDARHRGITLYITFNSDADGEDDEEGEDEEDKRNCKAQLYHFHPELRYNTQFVVITEDSEDNLRIIYENWCEKSEESFDKLQELMKECQSQNRALVVDQTMSNAYGARYTFVNLGLDLDLDN
jgi:hypothetical protein